MTNRSILWIIRLVILSTLAFAAIFIQVANSLFEASAAARQRLNKTMDVANFRSPYF